MSTKNFEVLLQKNGRIQWMPVPGCITHSEARSQGEEMYDGNILQTRFSGVDYDDENDDDDGGGGLSGAFGGLVLLAAGAVIDNHLDSIEVRIEKLEKKERWRDILALVQEYREWGQTDQGEDYNMMWMEDLNNYKHLMD